MQDTLVNIPYTLSRYVLQRRLNSPFRLFVCLKKYRSGKFEITKDSIESLALELNVHPRTIKNNLKKLVELKWLEITGTIGYLRGFGYLCKYYKLGSFKDCFEFDLNEIRTLKEAAFTSIIERKIKFKNWAFNKLKKMGDVAVSIIPGAKNATFDYLVYASDCTRISLNKLSISVSKAKSTVRRYKQKATAAGYINVTPTYVRLAIPASEIGFAMQEQPWMGITYINGEYYQRTSDGFTLRKK